MIRRLADPIRIAALQLRIRQQDTRLAGQRDTLRRIRTLIATTRQNGSSTIPLADLLAAINGEVAR